MLFLNSDTDNDDTIYVKELTEKFEKLECFLNSIEIISRRNSKSLSPLFYDLIGIEELNDQRTMIVCIHENIGELSLKKQLKIVAVGEAFSEVVNCPYLDFEITRQAIDQKYSSCKILWIESQDIHKGHGSLLLNNLILYIKSRYRSISDIHGDLVAEERPTKQAHAERLESCYRSDCKP